METDVYKTAGEEAGRSAESAKRAMSQAYEKTSKALSGTYDQALTYVKENPGKTTLIALGIGVGLGLLLASGGRRSRVRRFGEPIVNALSDIALEVIRGL